MKQDNGWLNKHVQILALLYPNRVIFITFYVPSGSISSSVRKRQWHVPHSIIVCVKLFKMYNFGNCYYCGHFQKDFDYIFPNIFKYIKKGTMNAESITFQKHFNRKH